MSEELATLNPSQYSLRPTTIEQAMELAKILADSSFVPKEYQGKPGNVLAAVQMGAEVGLHPMQAVQGIAVINGRPSIWGDAALALCRQAPEFVDIDERPPHEAATQGGRCTITYRNGLGEIKTLTRDFTPADAKAAGLSGKDGPWKTYPGRMFQMRARSWAMRDCPPCCARLKGFGVAEEAQDFRVDATTPEGVDVMMPRAKPAEKATEWRPDDKPEATAPEKPQPAAKPPDDWNKRTQNRPSSAERQPDPKVARLQFINGVDRVDANGHVFWSVRMQDGDTSQDHKASTFSESIRDVATSLVGKFALCEVEVKEKNGKTHRNLVAISPDVSGEQAAEDVKF